jgi:hypothetical protein
MVNRSTLEFSVIARLTDLWRSIIAKHPSPEPSISSGIEVAIAVSNRLVPVVTRRHLTIAS